jgi:hypothetical protein
MVVSDFISFALLLDRYCYLFGTAVVDSSLKRIHRHTIRVGIKEFSRKLYEKQVIDFDSFFTIFIGYYRLRIM